MDRVQKRCLIASGATHVFLILLLVFGSAFFVPEPKPVFKGRLNVVPSRLVDAALSGGGGNPKVKPSDERQKGNTLTPQPEEPKPVAPKPPEKAAPPKPKPDKSQEPPEPKVAEKPAPPKKGSAKSEASDLLKPVSKAEAMKLKAQLSGSRDSSGSRSASGPSKGEADRVAGAIAALRAGYTDGTAVEVHGTGGEAYANYGQFIFEIYDQAWILDKDVNGEDATTKVQVIIERSGRVKQARIIRPSGNAALDATVQKALNRVKTVPPFPAGAKDLERVFIINFNLQAKLSSA